MKSVNLFIFLFFTLNLTGQTDLETWFTSTIYGQTFIEGTILETVTQHPDPQSILMLAMEQDRIMIVVRHNNSYGISPDTIQSSGCFGPTCGTNGPQYYITILQGDTIEVIAH